jgi:hypothetical protein
VDKFRERQARADSEELLKLVIESSTDFAIFTTDPAGCRNRLRD